MITKFHRLIRNITATSSTTTTFTGAGPSATSTILANSNGGIITSLELVNIPGSWYNKNTVDERPHLGNLVVDIESASFPNISVIGGQKLIATNSKVSWFNNLDALNARDLISRMRLDSSNPGSRIIPGYISGTDIVVRYNIDRSDISGNAHHLQITMDLLVIEDTPGIN